MHYHSRERKADDIKYSTKVVILTVRSKHKISVVFRIFHSIVHKSFMILSIALLISNILILVYVYVMILISYNIVSYHM